MHLPERHAEKIADLLRQAGVAVPEKIFHLSSWRARTGFFSPFGSLLWVDVFFSSAIAEVAASAVTTGGTVPVFAAFPSSNTPQYLVE